MEWRSSAAAHASCGCPRWLIVVAFSYRTDEDGLNASSEQHRLIYDTSSTQCYPQPRITRSHITRSES